MNAGPFLLCFKEVVGVTGIGFSEDGGGEPASLVFVLVRSRASLVWTGVGVAGRTAVGVRGRLDGDLGSGGDVEPISASRSEYARR